MFDKYGEFGSYEEINKAAQGFKDEGDLDSLKAMARENGIDELDAEDYIEGTIPELVTLTSAAVGRLKVEKEASKKDQGILTVLFNMAEAMATSDKEDAAMFLTKGKRLDGVIEEMRKEAERNKSGNCGCVCGTDLDLMRRIRAYYGRSAA